MQQRIVLAIAILAGILAFGLTHRYLKNERERITAGYQKVLVLAAKKDLPAGTVLETGDLVAAIRAIALPDDRAATMGYLASPFSGLSVEQALRLLEPDAPPLREAHPAAAARLEELRTAARYSGMVSALVLLLKDQSFLASYPAWRRRIDSVRALT